jgi:acyl-ACP thioesterase
LNDFYESLKVIQAHEVDFTNRLRIDSLFILLQDTAAAHADLLNLGYKALIEHNFAWVLSWVKVEIDSLPRFGEEINIKTWPKKKYKLYSLRDFYVYSNKGQIIIRATTAWLPINMKTKRIIDTSSLPALINYQENESAIDELPGKIAEPVKREFVFSRQMRYTDLDLNQHVNNIRYIKMIMDSYSKEQYEKSRLKSIVVNFVSESKYNDEIEIYRSIEGSEESAIIEGANISTSKIVFQANLKWEILK